jgi:hypothetical protein
MYDRQEGEYYQAKLKAARRLGHGWIKPAELPSNAEIRDEVQQLARIVEGSARFDNLRDMRCEALRLMKILARFRPRLVGSVLTGHVRRGSDIDLHVFSHSLESVTAELEYHGMRFDTESKRITKKGQTRIYRHIHVTDRYSFELTVYPENLAHQVFKSSITGKPMERASIGELEMFLAREYPGFDSDAASADAAGKVDRFQVFYSLLLPLEYVKQSPRFHPEGDVLYHSLQVYDLAANEYPYDEEFLLAALLHDVGKAIEPADHVQAGLDALDGFISERTRWLIEHHMEGHRIRERTIGARALRRLQANESFDELVLLSRLDWLGRKVGVETTSLEDALQSIRDLDCRE